MDRGHDDRLDGVRALAVMAVALYHENLLPGGSIGVDVFFVLSGWLITTMLWREAERSGGIDISAFVVRRAKRLVPALALLLVVYAALAPILWPAWLSTRWLQVGAAALYLTNWREAAVPAKDPLAHTWSLAIEAQFYLLWPLVILGARRLGQARAGLLFLAAWPVLTIVRNALLWAGMDETAYFAFPLHATGLVLGSAIALRPPATAKTAGSLGLVVLALITFIPHQHDTFAWRVPLGELAAAAVILAPPSWLAAPPLVFVGAVSYGVYLWHIPVWLAFWNGPYKVAQVVMIPLSLALATVSYYTVEAPFRRKATPRQTAGAIA
jgi:peptidoglycan/LPS O-acetylase OafA/YrhL